LTEGIPQASHGISLWTNLDAFVKVTKAVTPAKAGVQKSFFFLDSGFRRNDRKGRFPTFYERINLISNQQKIVAILLLI